MEKILLSEVAGGELQEKTQEAIESVVRNLSDPNTPWKNKREINIKLKFTQNEDRSDVTLDISVEKKLASAKPTATRLAIATDLDNGEIHCMEYGSNVRGQMSFDDVSTQHTTEVNGETIDTETGEIIDFQSKQA